jgi:hypothetical protein
MPYGIRSTINYVIWPIKIADNIAISRMPVSKIMSLPDR